MKTNHFALLLGFIAIVGLLVLHFILQSQRNSISRPLTNNSASYPTRVETQNRASQIITITNKQFAESSVEKPLNSIKIIAHDTNQPTVELFRVNVNSGLLMYVAVKEDNETVFFRNNNGQISWSANFIEHLERDLHLTITNKEITAMKLVDGNIEVTVDGKNYPIVIRPDDPRNQGNNTLSINSINTTNQIELFKVVTNPQSGQYACVSSDRTTISLKNKDGTIIWFRKITLNLEHPFNEISGDGRIDSMKLYKNKLVIFVGREVVSIDTQTGESIMEGSN